MPIPVESSTPAPVGVLDGRLRFPATDDRLAYEVHGPNLPIYAQSGKPVVIYSDAAGSVLADIVNNAGAAIAGSSLTVDNNSQIPEFFGPVGVEVLYARLNGGTAYPIYAWLQGRYNDLLDEIAALQADDTAVDNRLGTLEAYDISLDSRVSAVTAEVDQLQLTPSAENMVTKGSLVLNVKDYGAVGDGVADDTAAIQAAINVGAVSGRPGVVLFPSVGGPGLYKTTSTLNIPLNAAAGMVLHSPARSAVGYGARLKWAGAAGGTMLSINGSERVTISNLGFDGSGVGGAATLISATSKRGLQLLNVFGTGWTGNGTTGAGLKIGNGTANLNEFYSSGLWLQGNVAGAVGIVLDATSTEHAIFDNTLLNVSPANIGLSSWVHTNVQTIFRGLTMDDGAMTDYAIRSTAGVIQLLDFASETPKVLWTAAAARIGTSIIKGNARSLAPGSGEFAMHLQGIGHFRIEGTRFQRKAGAAFAPNVQIGTSVLGVVEEGVIWDSADAGAAGTYVGSISKLMAIARPRNITIPANTTVDYTLALGDEGSSIGASSTGAIVVTIPPNSSVPFPIGTEVRLRRVNTGSVTFAAGAGVTIRSAGSLLAARVQYSVISALKTAVDTWYVQGDLA